MCVHVGRRVEAVVGEHVGVTAGLAGEFGNVDVGGMEWSHEAPKLLAAYDAIFERL